MKDYPLWIDEYAKSFHNAFNKMVPSNWGPIDALNLESHLNGTFIDKISEAVVRTKKNYFIEAAAKAFSTPSTIRALLLYIVTEYQYSEKKNKKQFREVIDFLIDALSYWMKRDLFCYESNVIRTDAEIEQVLKETSWNNGSREMARELGKLYTSASSLIYALYRDFFPQDGADVYGPYDASTEFGNGTILLIKHFSKIRPVELWPNAQEFKYSDINIFQVYRGVIFRCEGIGIHSLYEGDLMNGLVAYAVVLNGKMINSLEEIKELSDYFAKLATSQSQLYETMSKKELIEKTLEWLCYQFYGLFKLAEMDWRPTEAMKKEVQGKNIPERLYMESFPSFEEFTTSPQYEVYWMKELYN